MGEAGEIIKNLVLTMEAAIRSGDWKVDGACDPDGLIREAEDYLSRFGYRRDGLTGTEFIKE